MALTQGSHVLHRLNREKHGKIFLSESIRSRALIFGMQHHLVDLYQICSNYAPGAKMALHLGPGAKNGPASKSHVLHRLIQGEPWKNLLFWNHKVKSHDIWYVASPGKPLRSLFKLYPWGQKWARSWGHMFYIGLYMETYWKHLLFWNQKI